MSEERTCKRLLNVLTGVRVEASFDRWLFVQRAWSRYATGHGTLEDVEKAIRTAVKDFEDLLPDHRSMQDVELSVVRDTQDQCSACRHEWETFEEDGQTFCAHCGALVQEGKSDE